MPSDISSDSAGLLWARERALYDVVFEDHVVGRYSVELNPDAETGILGLVALYEDPNVCTEAELRLLRDTLLPQSVFKRIRSPQGDFEISATYGEENLELRAQTPGGPQALELPLPERVFDNDSVLTIIRAMPLAPGYRGSVEVANVDNGRTYFAWVERIAEHPVTGPGGTATCHHVKLTFDNAESHEMWYSVDRPHHLLRYDNRSVVFVLQQISREPV